MRQIQKNFSHDLQNILKLLDQSNIKDTRVSYQQFTRQFTSKKSPIQIITSDQSQQNSSIPKVKSKVKNKAKHNSQKSNLKKKSLVKKPKSISFISGIEPSNPNSELFIGEKFKLFLLKRLYQKEQLKKLFDFWYKKLTRKLLKMRQEQLVIPTTKQDTSSDSDTDDDKPILLIPSPNIYYDELSDNTSSDHSETENLDVTNTLQLFPKERNRPPPINIFAEKAPVEEPIQIKSESESEIKKYLRNIITKSFFESVKSAQKANLPLPPISVPPNLQKPWKFNDEFCELVIDVVTEFIQTTNFQNYSFEEFLDCLSNFFEISHSQRNKTIFTELEDLYHDRFNQFLLNYSIDFADSLLNNQFDLVLGK